MMFLCVMLLIFSGFMETTSENFKVVGPAAPLVVEAGEDVVLPCSLQPSISAVDMMVEWIRPDLSDNRLVHLYKDHKDTNDKQIKSYRGRTALFKEELQKGNTSLKLSAVQPSDEGVYQCAIKSESWFDDIAVHVEVKTLLKVVGPAASLVVKAGEDLVLPCSLEPRISAEDMMVEWIRLYLDERLVHLYVDYEDRNQRQMESYRGRTSLFKEELKKGNTSVKLSAVQPSDEGFYQCYIRYGDWDDEVKVYVEVKVSY
ncbi:butyrophilin-like protein 2 [Colossoma macropomum]|uniref:butyrophilin-like protein 2 n=1 Tax=Colossoma macropomum TaxID=42526 RepID=UPI0018651020|nr:butyrophilin-like protein 2 [Colossoma macropomum]